MTLKDEDVPYLSEARALAKALLLALCQTMQLIPASSCIGGVEGAPMDEDVIARGGFGDVRSARLHGTRVAVKRVRKLRDSSSTPKVVIPALRRMLTTHHW